MTYPRLLRRAPITTLPDPDWAATQSPPLAVLTVDAGSASAIRVFTIARGVDDIPMQADVFLQLVSVSPLEPFDPPVTVVWGSDLVLATNGRGVVFDTREAVAVTVRVVLVSVPAETVAIDVYWIPLD